jgi:hypothetical protein
MSMRNVWVAAAAAVLMLFGGSRAARAQVPEAVTDPLAPALQTVCSALDCEDFCPVCPVDEPETKFPATGQTTKYAAGDDGDLKKGAPLSYTDNGDGTITDNNTLLVWEAKTGCGGGGSATNLHAGDNWYPWRGHCSMSFAFCGTDADCSSGTCNASDGQGTGMTIFKWVAALNGANFAGHNDWRIPNVKELQSIVDYGNSDPAVASAFSSGSSSCTVSVASSAGYWSSTATTNSSYAWYINFNIGVVYVDFKTTGYYVRAVRGGS